MGYGLWNADTTVLAPGTNICALCAVQVQGGKGYLGVVGAGYDYQFAPTWVAGAFGDFNVSSLKGTIQTQGPQWNGEIKQTSAWAGGARLGWLPSQQTMTYVNGGYSGAQFSGTTPVSNFSGAVIGNTTPGFSRSGWFVGGGVETTFDFFGMLGKGWFWRSEYRYASYGTQTVVDSTGINAITFKPVVQTVTSQVVFKFN
jgi:outer membrane immunogenic protein